MNKKIIQFRNVEQIVEFVNAAEKYEYSIYVSYKTTFRNAKSIMGILSMDLGRPLSVEYGIPDEKLENVLKKLVVLAS